MGKSANVRDDSGNKKTRKVRSNSGQGTIALTQGLSATVDLEDATALRQYNWHVSRSHGKPYAVRRGPKGSGVRVIRMHRIVIGAPDDVTVDHINGNTLDNRKSNLRICSQAENVRNRSKSRSRQTSQYLGVYFDKDSRKWRACIRAEGRPKHIGVFADEVSAARAYDAAAMAHHGEFARLNFPSLSSTPPVSAPPHSSEMVGGL